MTIKILLHNTETLQSAKGNHDLSYCLNWVLFLTVVLWLSGIMFFVVATDDSKYIEIILTQYIFIAKEFKKDNNWLHQLCKKLAKETIFNIWRNEKYFRFCLFISCLVTILAKSSTKILSIMISIGFCPNSNQTADR